MRGAPPAASAPHDGTRRRSGGAARGAGAAPAQAAPPVRKLARSWASTSRRSRQRPDGRVSAADVRAAAAGVDRATARRTDDPTRTTRREPLRGVRRAMARNMADAWREVPHISLFDEIDARPLLDALRAARELSGDESLTLTAFFVRAARGRARRAPDPERRVRRRRPTRSCTTTRATSAWRSRATTGLVVPVVHDVQAMSLLELGAEIARVTDGRARRAPRAGGDHGRHVHLTNYGTEGGRFATPIVRPPQVAILGFGAVRVRPVVDGDAVVAAPALPLSLSADHRVIDGHDATGFLDHLAGAPARAARPARRPCLTVASGRLGEQSRIEATRELG